MTGQKVEALTHLGMGRLESGAFVPRVLPGEVVETEGDSLRILVPSPDRIAAPCRHFKTCGGCAMQHASALFVAEWKQDIVRRALQAQGLLPEFRTIATSPPESRRRAKLSARRTKRGALVGFHARASDVVVEIPDCKLLMPDLIALLPALEALTVQVASRKGEVALTVTTSTAGPDVRIDSTQPLTPQLRIDLAVFAQTHRLARLTWGDEAIVTIAPPAQQFGKAQVVPPPGAFLQATKAGESTLLSAVLETVLGAHKVVDLFAGCGTFSLPIAEHAEVHAVEGAADMLVALDRGWRTASGLKRVTTEARDLFRRPLEPDELNQFDAAVIDPPRAGAEAQIDRLAQSALKVVAMVSCNPVTFARDAAVLTEAGFSTNWVQVVDQFRWSPHTEVVASFTRH